MIIETLKTLPSCFLQKFIFNNFDSMINPKSWLHYNDDYSCSDGLIEPFPHFHHRCHIRYIRSAVNSHFAFCPGISSTCDSLILWKLALNNVYCQALLLSIHTFRHVIYLLQKSLHSSWTFSNSSKWILNTCIEIIIKSSTSLLPVKKGFLSLCWCWNIKHWLK